MENVARILEPPERKLQRVAEVDAVPQRQSDGAVLTLGELRMDYHDPVPVKTLIRHGLPLSYTPALLRTRGCALG
ncbi:hypothetical protein J6590_017062 [Homalodisca vitripennis]|nr:hypothetical protein J6590_017062 [Homalodisca vitripennis]